jgi:hypothetical protein
MRTLLTMLLAFALLAGNAQPIDTALTNRFLLNFAVPDMPAAKALGTDASNLLRPSDVQKFAASFQPFYSGGQGVIPKNFALEFAPWKLASRNWNLGRYNKGINSLLYNSAFSVATVRDTSSYASKLSIGYHLSIGSRNSDILKAVYNTPLGTELFTIQTDLFVLYDDLRAHWAYNVKRILRSESPVSYTNGHMGEFLDYLQGLWGTAIADTILSRHFQNFLNTFNLHTRPDFDAFIASARKNDPAKLIADRVDKLIAHWKDSMWNAGRTDIAVAYTAASKDTLIKNAQFSSFNLWVTQACRISTWGQLLLGGSLALPRTEKNDTVTTNTSYTLNARLYAGSNSIKGFFETQYQYQNYSGYKKALLFNLGAEFTIAQQFWVVASAGINNYLGLSNPLGVLVSGISLRYGFNKPK